MRVKRHRFTSIRRRETTDGRQLLSASPSSEDDLHNVGFTGSSAKPSDRQLASQMLTLGVGAMALCQLKEVRAQIARTFDGFYKQLSPQKTNCRRIEFTPIT